MSGMTIEDAFHSAGFPGRNTNRLMLKPEIKAALYQKSKEHEVAGDISTSQWLRELSTIGFMPSHMLAGPPTWENKLKALELLGRYQKWLTDNKHVRVEIGIARLFGAATTAVMQEVASAAAVPIEGHLVGDELVTALSGAVLEHAPAEGKS